MTPFHVAITMDGNGRWAELRGLPRTEGHRHGAVAVRRVVEAATAIRDHDADALRVFGEQLATPEGGSSGADDDLR